MKSKDKKLTSVRIDPKLWEDFKEQTQNNKFSFKHLAEASLHRFLNDSKYQNEMLNYNKHII